MKFDFYGMSLAGGAGDIPAAASWIKAG